MRRPANAARSAPEHFVEAALHLFLGEGLDELRDDPHVAEGVLDASRAVTVELVVDQNEHLGARPLRRLHRRVRVLIMAVTVGSRELKNRLGSYLRQVRGGTTIVVTDRGSPVAELRPVQPAATEDEQRLDALVASGLLAPRTRTGLAEREPATVEDGDLAGAVRDGREERL